MTSSVQLTSQSLLDIFASFPAAHGDACETDDNALAAHAAHNREAFAELYTRYANSIYRYMLAHVGDVQDAQDLTAQTFLAGLEGIDTFQGRGKFVAWLFSIAYRKAMDYYRRQRATVPLETLAETPYPGQQLDQMVEDRFDFEQLSAAIRTLAPDRAEVITLRVFAELSISEIANLMGRSESAVRMLLSRAVQDLKRIMAPMTTTTSTTANSGQTTSG